MNKACKELLKMIKVVNIDYQTFLAEYVECDLVYLGDSTGKHYSYVLNS